MPNSEMKYPSISYETPEGTVTFGPTGRFPGRIEARIETGPRTEIRIDASGDGDIEISFTRDKFTIELNAANCFTLVPKEY